MNTFFEIEELPMDITISDEIIFCDHGKLEYYFDDDTAIVNSISVYAKRNRVGSRLVKELELLARQNLIKNIEVPASPTKEAISFWKSLDYKTKDKVLSNKIIKSNREDSWDIPQGVVVMTKQI